MRPVSTWSIDTLRSDDWPAVASIFAEGIATGCATFETVVPSWRDWNAAHLPAPRLVARDANGHVVAWAALVPASRRACYAGVAELSVYVAARARGKGVGRALLDALVAASEAAGFWTLQAVVFPENGASIALHARCGFRLVGRRERIARNGSHWQDTLLFERRSSRSGVEKP
jgi:phosphinothricin acetyltransferase